MNKQFQKLIYVQHDENSKGDEETVIAWENVDNVDDGIVAIYEFVKTVRKSTKTILN